MERETLLDRLGNSQSRAERSTCSRQIRDSQALDLYSRLTEDFQSCGFTLEDIKDSYNARTRVFGGNVKGDDITLAKVSYGISHLRTLEDMKLIIYDCESKKYHLNSMVPLWESFDYEYGD